MAEIYNVEISTEETVKELAAAQKKVKELKTEIKELSKAEGDNSEAIAAKTIELQAENSKLQEVNKVIKANIKANELQEGSIDSMRAELSKVSKQWSALSEDQRLNTEEGKKLAAQKLKLTEALKAEEKATGDSRRNVGNYTESINEAIGSLSGISPVAGKAASGFKMIGSGVNAALGPVGLIIAAITLVVKALNSFFTSSEEGQNKLRSLQAIANVVFGNISDLLSKLGGLIVSVFENPKQALQDFWKLIKENVVNRVEGLLELFPALGKSISLAFKGKFQEAAKVSADAMLKITTGVEDFTTKAVNGFNKAKESLSGLIEEQKKEISIAQKLSGIQDELDKKVRNNIVDEAQLRSDIAKLKLKATEKDKYSSQEQLEFLDEAIAKENQILQNNIDIAAQKLYIKQEQNKLSNSTKEDLDEEARLQAALIQVREQAFSRQRELTSQRVTAINAIKAETEAAAKAEAAAVDALVDEELDSLMRLYDEANSAMAAEGDAASTAAIERLEALKEAYETNQSNIAAIRDSNIFSELQAQKQALNTMYAEEIKHAKKVGADTALIDKKYSKAKEAIAEAEFAAKMDLASQFAANVATIAGESTAVGKAAAVAVTTIETYKAATSAYAAMAGIPIVGPALGIAAAGAAVAAGVANVKKILAVDANSSSTSTSTGSASSSTTTATSTDSTVSDVNTEILSRTGSDIVESNDANDSVAVLVVDDVTNAQSESSTQVKASSI